jgi:omega-6 fatty acid desaturase (delta-12 desaturase)
MSHNVAPCPEALSHLRPRNRDGLLIVGCASALTAIAIWLSAGEGLGWLAGQVLLGLAFVQWFIVLHEAGHDTLFRGRRLNALAGRIAGVIALIPYRSWRRVHGRHHKWTGWQDLDPTTASLTRRERPRLQRWLINTCWRLWIPLFSIIYRLENFWNLPRLLVLFPREADRRALKREALALVAMYATVGIVLGPALLIRIVGLALVVSFAIEDLLLLSQHTHIPQHVSNGAAVRPYPAIEQAGFTRSLRLPGFLSSLALHFDSHELHHMYPFVPGCHLRRIPYQPSNEIGWWQWVTRAKQLRGEVLLFENRLHTGWDI